MRNIIPRSGVCSECKTFSKSLFLVPTDEVRNGKPLFAYVCEYCMRGDYDPFDDPDVEEEDAQSRP